MLQFLGDFITTAPYRGFAPGPSFVVGPNMIYMYNISAAD